MEDLRFEWDEKKNEINIAIEKRKQLELYPHERQM